MPPRSEMPQFDPALGRYPADTVAQAIATTMFHEASAVEQRLAGAPDQDPAALRYVRAAREAGSVALQQATESDDGADLARRLSNYARALQTLPDERFGRSHSWWHSRPNREAVARHLTRATRQPAEDLMRQPSRSEAAAPVGAANTAAMAPERPAREPERKLSPDEAIRMFISEAGASVAVHVNGPDSDVGPSGSQWYGPGRHLKAQYVNDFRPTHNGLSRALLKGVTDPAEVPVETITFVATNERDEAGAPLVRIHYGFDPRFMGDNNAYTAARDKGHMPNFPEFNTRPGSTLREGGTVSLGLALPYRRARQLLTIARKHPTFLRDLTGHAVTSLGPPEYAGLWKPERPSLRPPYDQLPHDWKLWIFENIDPRREHLSAIITDDSVGTETLRYGMERVLVSA